MELLLWRIDLETEHALQQESQSQTQSEVGPKELPDSLDLCLPGRIAAEHQCWPRFHAAASLPECAE